MLELVYLLIGLFIVAVVLFILSFFQADHYKLLREELEQFSLQQMQENYLLKKKIKILEEEMLINDGNFSTRVSRPARPIVVNEILKNQVISLAKQGVPLNQISKQSSLSINDIEKILSESRLRGNRHE